MIKKIIKETAIVLLLCIAIILILGLLFYKYIPTNKIVPNKVAYEMPENIAEELQNDVDGTSFVNITYTLDPAAIKNSKRTNEYNPGRQNPFASIDQVNDGNTANSNSNTGSSNTNKPGSSDDGSYLPSGGAK